MTYGWLASGIFALWAETLIRLLAIEAEVDQQEQPGVATATSAG